MQIIFSLHTGEIRGIDLSTKPVGCAVTGWMRDSLNGESGPGQSSILSRSSGLAINNLGSKYFGSVVCEFGAFWGGGGFGGRLGGGEIRTDWPARSYSTWPRMLAASSADGRPYLRLRQRTNLIAYKHKMKAITIVIPSSKKPDWDFMWKIGRLCSVMLVHLLLISDWNPVKFKSVLSSVMARS